MTPVMRTPEAPFPRAVVAGLVGPNQITLDLIVRCVFPIQTPPRHYPRSDCPSPPSVPPISLFEAPSITMPRSPFPRAAVPLMSVPM